MNEYIELTDDDLNQVINKRYRFEEEIGEGSFASVWKAFDLITNNHVAIKVISKNEDNDKYSDNEIKIYQELMTNITDDINIIKFLDLFEYKGHKCLVFNLVNEELDIFMKNTYEIKKVVIDLMNALSYVHKHNIIHSDVKLDNILHNKDDTGYILADFGNSIKETDEPYTYAACDVYRSPESILGGKITNKIDIWSAACIIYELLTDSTLFDLSNRETDDKDEHHMACINELLPCAKKFIKYKKYKFDTVKYFNKKSMKSLLRYHHFSYEEASDISDMLLPMLSCFSENRPSADEVLKCKWLKTDYRNTYSKNKLSKSLTPLSKRLDYYLWKHDI